MSCVCVYHIYNTHFRKEDMKEKQGKGGDGETHNFWDGRTDRQTDRGSYRVGAKLKRTKNSIRREDWNKKFERFQDHVGSHTSVKFNNKFSISCPY